MTWKRLVQQGGDRVVVAFLPLDQSQEAMTSESATPEKKPVTQSIAQPGEKRWTTPLAMKKRNQRMRTTEEPVGAASNVSGA